MKTLIKSTGFALAAAAALAQVRGPLSPSRRRPLRPSVQSTTVMILQGTLEQVDDVSLVLTTRDDRTVRVGFTTHITKAQLAAPESPRFVIFAKGDEAQHMIIVALDDEVFKTIYRARAVLAQLTSNVRGTDFFINSNIEDYATWFDLAKMLGFDDLVISDGATWSHRVIFE